MPGVPPITVPKGEGCFFSFVDGMPGPEHPTHTQEHLTEMCITSQWAGVSLALQHRGFVSTMHINMRRPQSATQHSKGVQSREVYLRWAGGGKVIHSASRAAPTRGLFQPPKRTKLADQASGCQNFMMWTGPPQLWENSWSLAPQPHQLPFVPFKAAQPVSASEAGWVGQCCDRRRCWTT